jgi:hypothetical protein
VGEETALRGSQSTGRSQLLTDLVAALLQHLRDSGVDLAMLAEDPAATLSALGDVAVVPVDPATLPIHCSVAACYDAKSRPPRLLVAQDVTAGRRAFSTLHEYAHHLRNHVDAVVDAFWAMPDGGASIEEDLADAFAAAVLLPERIVAEAFAEGITAAAVARLWHASPASREACCVAAANRLSSPGYVMLLDRAGISRFAARCGDALPVRRGTRQAAAKLAAALRGGRARGVDRPRYASGVLAGEMHLDAVADGDYVFAVWVTDSPPWDALPVPLQAAPTGHDGYCEACGLEFTSWTAACRDCAEPRCPRCGGCSCEHGYSVASTAVKTRRCSRCFLELPISAFDGNSETCNDH